MCQFKIVKEMGLYFLELLRLLFLMDDQNNPKTLNTLNYYDFGKIGVL